VTGSEEIWKSFGQVLPSEGWKIHVSCIAGGLATLISKVNASNLLKNQAFKVVRSEAHLQLLNSGLYGVSQIGKCLTIYPTSDLEAIRLSTRLAIVLKGYLGPVIENEIRVNKRSPVYLRYGSFFIPQTRDKLGIPISLVTTIDGLKLDDDRSEIGHLRLGRRALIDGSVFCVPVKIGDRYVLVRKISDKGYSSVYLAVDRLGDASCAIRISKKHASIDGAGRDSAGRAKAEVDFLRKFTNSEFFPKTLGSFYSDDAFVTVREWRSGVSVAKLIGTPNFGYESKLTLLRSLATLVDLVHEQGYLIGDLSPANLIVDEKFKVCLVDTEAVVPMKGGTATNFGTPGYSHPGFLTRNVLSRDVDEYSIACISFALESGIDLGRTANPESVLLKTEYCVGFKNSLTAQLLIGRQQGRKSSEVLDSLTKPAAFADTETPTSLVANDYTVSVLRSLSASLVSDAIQHDGIYPAWQSKAKGMNGLISSDMYSGGAGVLFGLLRAAHGLADEDLLEFVFVNSKTILLQVYAEKLPGLFIGRTGYGWLCLALWEVSRDDKWIDLANAIADSIQEIDSPDLTHGKAGVLLFFSWLLAQCYSSKLAQRALLLVEDLITSKEEVCGVPLWTLPSGYKDLSGEAWLGLAHGSGGICLALMEASTVLRHSDAHSVSQQFLSAISGVSRVTSGGLLKDIPDRIGGSYRSGVWCHGAAGIAWVFEKAQSFKTFEVPHNQLYETSIEYSIHSDFSLCHGHAACLELACERNDQHAIQLRQRLLDLFSYNTDGLVRIRSSATATATPDLMVGTAGVVSAVSRYLFPERLGYFLDKPSIAFRHPDAFNPALTS
jgi:serine/threonine protein kinase